MIRPTVRYTLQQRNILSVHRMLHICFVCRLFDCTVYIDSVLINFVHTERISVGVIYVTSMHAFTQCSIYGRAPLYLQMPDTVTFAMFV